MIKRSFDFVCAFFGLLLLSPVFVLLSLWVLIDSGLPVFYFQSRVGKGGVDFLLFKFRSMMRGSDQKGLLTSKNDPRITKSGKVLRKTKLDELPQLWNVLIGDMSLVGPRPEVRKYVELYSEEQKQVLTVRPGLTDKATIEYARESEMLDGNKEPERTYVEVIMPAKLRISLDYLKKADFISDLGILFSTIKRIF